VKKVDKSFTQDGQQLIVGQKERPRTLANFAVGKFANENSDK
jgi:hypothetical protein